MLVQISLQRRPDGHCEILLPYLLTPSTVNAFAVDQRRQWLTASLQAIIIFMKELHKDNNEYYYFVS